MAILPKGLHVQVQDSMFHLRTTRLQPLVAWSQVLSTLPAALMLKARCWQDAVPKVQATDAKVTFTALSVAAARPTKKDRSRLLRSDPLRAQHGRTPVGAEIQGAEGQVSRLPGNRET